MNEVLYHLCKRCVNIMDGWIPYPSTILCKVCNLSLYKTRKELKVLKEQGIDRAKVKQVDALLELVKSRKNLQKATEKEHKNKADSSQFLALFGL